MAAQRHPPVKVMGVAGVVGILTIVFLSWWGCWKSFQVCQAVAGLYGCVGWCAGHTSYSTVHGNLLILFHCFSDVRALSPITIPLNGPRGRMTKGSILAGELLVWIRNDATGDILTLAILVSLLSTPLGEMYEHTTITNGDNSYSQRDR
jgi:hypothetical protein